MYRYTLTLPPGHNALEVQSTLTTLFGGWTSHSARGGWRNPETGHLYVERMRVYSTDSDRPDAWARLLNYAGWLAWKYGEDAVYVTRQPIEAIAVAPMIPVDIGREVVS